MDAGVLVLAVQQYPITKQFTDNKLCARAWLWRAGDANRLPECHSTSSSTERREAGGLTYIEQKYFLAHNRVRAIDSERY